MILNEGVNVLIGAPLVYQVAKPRADTIIPKVAMNGGTLA